MYTNVDSSSVTVDSFSLNTCFIRSTATVIEHFLVSATSRKENEEKETIDNLIYSLNDSDFPIPEENEKQLTCCRFFDLWTVTIYPLLVFLKNFGQCLKNPFKSFFEDGSSRQYEINNN